MRAEIEREIQKAGRRLATNYVAKGPSKKVRYMIRADQKELSKIHLQRGTGIHLCNSANFSRRTTS